MGIQIPTFAGVAGQNPMMGMNPVLAAALNAHGPMDWQGAGDFAQRANYADMPAGLSMLMQGQQGFGGQMAGAMGQMQGLLQNNAQAQQFNNQQALQAQLMREGRHDANQKFTMLYDALLKPTNKPVFNDGGRITRYEKVSPLLQAFKDMMNGGTSGFGASQVSFLG